MSRIVEDDAVKNSVLDAWMNGFHDDSAGNVDYSYGHYIYHEVDGEYYALWTDSLGNTQLIAFDTCVESEFHKDTIWGLDDTTDEMELY